MAKAVTFSVQFWQSRNSGQILVCSGNFLPSGPEWGLSFRRVRPVRHTVTGEVTIEEYTDACSLLDDPLVEEMSLEAFNEWKVYAENPDL